LQIAGIPVMNKLALYTNSGDRGATWKVKIAKLIDVKPRQKTDLTVEVRVGMKG